ncbi:MAG: penicillin-binding protein activator LpoB [Endomicrobia bacterium]|nr:penicillin-binding protein activator LpoB [Endomicrobiia bacterium]
MDLKKAAVYVFAVVLSVGLFACSGPQVTRLDPGEEVDFSGYWNDTDSHQVSAEMIGDSLNRPWLDEYIKKFSKKPRVIVGSVLNKTDEHITTETFIKDLEKELTNSGKVVMVASSMQRDEIRAERDDQAMNARADTAKAQGQETGADFMIKGQINTIPDQKKGAELKYYQVELEMIDISNNEKVWIGQKQIKKVIAKKKYKV